MKTALAVVVLVLSLVQPAFAQQDEAGARRAIAAVQEAIKQRPDDPTLYFFLARLEAEAGDAGATVAALAKVAELGDGFLPARELGFAKVWDDAKFQEVRARLESRLPRLDYAPIAFELEDSGLVPEGFAYDAASHDFFMGSIAKGKIVRLGADGSVKDFADRLDPVLGIAVDAPRRRLYAVSTSALTEAGRKERRNAVLSYETDSGRLVRRVDVPSAVQLNDVTVAPGGRVFASDSGNGAVYEIPLQGDPREVLAPGQVRGSNGLAASPDGKRLYVAHTTGIVVVDIATGAAKRVENATRENIAAIDGLYEWQGELIGVQNITNPGRVILIALARDGNSVSSVKTLLSHHHNRLDEPTTGAIKDSDFFLLAATGASHFTQKGTIDDPAAVPRPAVVRVLLPR